MRVTVLGAGPAGLAAADALAERGAGVRLFERDGQVGGMCRTVEQNGYRFDLGGHRFFTRFDEVEALWHDLLGDDLLRRNRKSRILYGGSLFEYPLSVPDVVGGLGPVEAARCLVSYAQARARPRGDEQSFEDWVRNRFGDRLFETFFQTYTEKVWGMPCSEIGAEWAAQRIKKLDLAIFWHPSPVSWASTRSWDALIDLDLAFIGTKEKAIEVPKSTTNALQESLYFMQYLNDLVINADSTMHIHYNLETPKASYIYTADTVTAKVRIQSTEQAVANQVYQLIQDKVKQRSTVADCKISLSLFRAIHAFIPNHTLMEVVNRNILKMGPINFSEEEQHQSRQIQAQFSLPTQGLKAKPLPFRATKEKQQLRKYASDIGDVSWWAPTLSFVSTCFPTGIPIGEAPAAELAFHSFGEKGMCYAVKVICASVIDYLQDEQLQQAIKEEFRQRLAGQSYSIQQPDIHPKAETNNKRSK